MITQGLVRLIWMGNFNTFIYVMVAFFFHSTLSVGGWRLVQRNDPNDSRGHGHTDTPLVDGRQSPGTSMLFLRDAMGRAASDPIGWK